MSDTVESDAHAAEALIAELQACGNEPVNNAWMAGRMPPGQCLGLHPAPKDGQPGIREVYVTNGDMFKELVEKLPEAMANPRMAFCQVAGTEAPQQNADLTLDPRMLL
ncbi:MAG TPA: hypothetical protein PK513_04105 [Alphaproteobacteria bacterium]|nr:hypothetical protein [Alphaproteobacteria bacterium]USO05063.1 MAG: hypothetical protein H6859_07860 [Rhodospirillales bacterium]HOO81665.1 hypothetical protein [Alphaproteobacteria bacterium]